MFCFPLTNWTMMRGAASTTVTQGESQWLDLRGFEDLVVWLHVQNSANNGGGAMALAFQSAPVKDEVLFTNVASVPLSANGLTVSKVIMTSASVPIARWLRWQLSSPGSSSAFDATFRIWVAANIGPHPLRPKTSSPPLRQNGKSCNGDCQKGGSPPSAGMLLPPRDAPLGNTGANRALGRTAPALRPGLGKRPPDHLIRAASGMVPPPAPPIF